jgi:hypothetical protein
VGSKRLDIGLCLFLVSASWAISWLLAGEAEAEEAATSTVVMVAEREEEEAARQVIHAVEAQLSDLPVVFHVSWIAALPASLAEQRAIALREAARLNARAVFWLGGEGAPSLFLTLADAREDVLRRSLESSAAFAENLALILRGVVQLIDAEPDSRAALLESSTWTRVAPAQATPANAEGAGSPVEEAAPAVSPAPPPPPAAPPAPTPRRRLALHLGYELALWSRQVTTLHGLDLALEVRLVRELWLFARYHLVLPSVITTDELELTLRRHPIIVGARYSWDLGRVTLGGSAALALDVVTEELELSAQLRAAGDGPELEVGARLLLELSVELLSWLSLDVGLGLVLPFNRVDYAFDDRDGEVELLSSFALRPIMHVGLRAGVF